MAIQKSKTLANGASGNYWKITSESYDKPSFKCSWIITLFCDKAHADAGAPSLGFSKTYTHTATKEELSGDRTALGYKKIKEKASSFIKGLRKDAPQMQFDADLADGTDA